MRVLVIEDDDRIRSDVQTALEAAGYIVDVEASGEEGWFLGDTETYGAVVLDLGLPQMDGMTVLKRWRKAGRAMPVLILTARGTWNERVEGIDAGADDYLPKPFHVEELLARLRAIIRRSGGNAGSVIKIGETELDERQMRVSVRGVTVNLSPQEYRLVSYLMLHNGRVISQQELAEHLQSVHFDRESNAVEVLVARVRRKLPNALIETRRGFGYLVPNGRTE
ncbi:response regulator transcription factor [Sulfitobacter pontiacus]